MQATAASRTLPPVIDGRRLVTSAAWTALLLFALLALLVAIRRLGGAMSPPIAGPILVPLAAGLAAAGVVLRLWLVPLRLPSLATTDIRNWLVLVVPSLALVGLLAAVITPGTSWPAAWGALLLAGLIEGLFWRHIAVALQPREVPAMSPPPLEAAADEMPDEIAEEESYPPNLLQQIVRTREASGEAIHAVLRADFPLGEQLQVLHVAFCPPLASAPRLEAFAAGEIDAEVKVTAAYSFGARLEVTLSRPATGATSVLVEVASL